MNAYQMEQIDAWRQILDAWTRMPAPERKALRQAVQDYVRFREEVDAFLKERFHGHCTTACYLNHRSACCSKDGILTFWADLVVEAVDSGMQRIAAMPAHIETPDIAHKCIYLSTGGCRWRIRPLVCAMFLCDAAQQAVFSRDPGSGRFWQALCRRARSFRWPDRPVLFDLIESRFMALGCRSPLMYLHTSPGLLRVKRAAGLADSAPRS